ncbi:MAG: tryptophan synthase subunit alpha [Planctomycetes bacterium]|nr:tryptophan synthase subunit alpha [Planctomycetota bacterium]
MSRIDEIFARHRASGQPVLMPFVTAGYPSLDVTRLVLPALESAGAGIVELGIPFSDPIADGPVIAASMHEALLGGVTPERVLDLVRDVRPEIGLGLVAMVSISIVHRLGPDRFAAEAAGAGIDGLIIPDLDSRDADVLTELADRHDLAFSLLVAPTTPEPRIAELVARCRGFVYVLARSGITGEQDAAPEVSTRVEEVRRHTDLPVAVGFGISTAAHVAAVTRVAEGAIVGSALVRRMDAADPVAAAAGFVGELAGGLVCG